MVMLFAARLFHVDNVVRVTEAAVTQGPIVRDIVATGTVQPEGSVEVGTQISGTVQSLAADYNSIVRAGDVLVRLDPQMYEVALQAANAALETALAATAQSQTAVDDALQRAARDEQLSFSHLIPQADVEADRAALAEARAAVDSAQAQAAQAQAAARQASDELKQSVIRSPTDGIVTERNVDVGQTVMATVQTPVLFRIATDLSRVQVVAAVDESDIASVRPGQGVTFQVDAYPSEVFSGVVLQIRLQPIREVPATGPGAMSASVPGGAPTRTAVSYPTVIEVMNPNEKLRPGMTATVTLAGARRDAAVRLPNNALLFRPPLAVLDAAGAPAPPADQTPGTQPAEVWEYTRGRFTPVLVSIGLSDDRWTELVAGAVHPGDELVTSAILDASAAH
jgi:HlyD family secretion protein